MFAIRMLLPVALTISAVAQTPRTSLEVRRSFQGAFADYRAGRYDQAAAQLEKIQQKVPDTFDVRELLGLTYGAQGREAQAEEQLRAAVRLSPESVSARNNLATSLMRLHKAADAEAEWHAALKMRPSDYTANRNLARLYLQQSKVQEAIPLLETARSSSQGNSDTYDNEYDLALALEMTGKLGEAREIAEGLLLRKPTGEVHVLLGQIGEKQGRYVEAVNEFSLAAHVDPSEANLFAWASELMAHRAYEAAIKVFEEGTRRYAGSPRLWVGQGMAFYARGDYKPSIEALLKATDLNAEDPRAYLFLSKAYLSSPSQANAVIERFRRYAELRPKDALAQYDYAISLWKGRRVNTPEVDYPAVETLLQRSIALDGSDAEVHLQLGVLYNEQHEYEQARVEFERAVRLDPALGDARFRLGRAYLRMGMKDQAQAQLDEFQRLQAQHQAALDKERAEVQQFVIATQGTGPSGPALQATQ